MRKKTLGVYMILNSKNGKIYIGSSKDIYKRWQEHKSDLKKNKHHNKYLQNSWNKNGEKFFYLYILEEIKIERKDYLILREQFYLDYYESYNKNRGYNINKKADSCLGVIRSNEYKEKCSERSKKRAIENNYWKGEKNPMFKTNVFNIWVKKYGIEEAINRKKLAFEKNSKSRKGRKIKVNQEAKKKSIQTMIKNTPSVLQIDKNGNTINEFESIRDAARKTNISRSNIAAVIKNKQKTAGGFIWKTKKKNNA